MALRTVLAILAVTLLGVNCTASRLQDWKETLEKVSKNLAWLSERKEKFLERKFQQITPASTTSLGYNYNAVSPYPYSWVSSPFQSSSYYYTKPTWYSLRKPVPFQSFNYNPSFNRFQPVVTPPKPSKSFTPPRISNDPTPDDDATKTTIVPPAALKAIPAVPVTSTTTQAPHGISYDPTPATKTTTVPPVAIKAVPAVPAEPVPAQPVKGSDRQTDERERDERILNFVDRFVSGKFYNSLQSSLTTTRTTTTTTSTTTTPAPAPYSDDTVLDFSSGQAQVVTSTVEKVEPISDQGLVKEGIKGFSIFKGLIDELGLADQYQDQDQNEGITIFTPGNKAFSELPFDVNTLDAHAQTRLITKHIVRGTFDAKSLPDGPLKTMNGESIYVARNENGKARIITDSGEAKIKIANIKTKLGIVHVVDKVFL